MSAEQRRWTGLRSTAPKPGTDPVLHMLHEAMVQSKRKVADINRAAGFGSALTGKWFSRERGATLASLRAVCDELGLDIVLVKKEGQADGKV